MTINQQQCELRSIRCYDLAERHYGRKFDRIPTEYSNRMTKTAGKLCIRGGKATLIRLSMVILNDNPTAFVARTVGHEIAHHIAHEVYGYGIRPHGREWKEVMNLFGQEASRCHSYKTVQNKVKYRVEGVDYFLGKIQHGRCQRGTVYINGKTKAKISAGNWVRD